MQVKISGYVVSESSLDFLKMLLLESLSAYFSMPFFCTLMSALLWTASSVGPDLSVPSDSVDKIFRDRGKV